MRAQRRDYRIVFVGTKICENIYAIGKLISLSVSY